MGARFRNKGEYVVYKDNGICVITDVNDDYYILAPVYSKNMTVYVPRGSEELCAQMNDILAREEVDGAIASVARCDAKWVDSPKQRAAEFTKLLKEGGRTGAFWVCKMLSSHKQKVEAAGRNFYASDTRLLEAAQRIVTGEVAFVLGITPAEAAEYINLRLHK